MSKTILEFGCGDTPYFLRYNIPLKNGDKYIGADINDKRLYKASLNIKPLPKDLQNNIRLVIADGIKMPFKNSSADLVVLSNVLSAPIHMDWNEDEKYLRVNNLSGIYKRELVKNKKEKDPFYTERKQTLNEALRILKKGGELIIYTDLLIYGVHSYNRIINNLKENKKLKFAEDKKESKRIDELNKQKLASGNFCKCFTAEVLPVSKVYKIFRLK